MVRLTEKELRKIRAPDKIMSQDALVTTEAKKIRPAKISKLESDFLLGIMLRSMPIPIRQYRFHDKRRWKLDFYWPRSSVAVETDGGTYTHGKKNKNGVVSRSGHLTPLGYYNDCCKGNHCAIAGITLLRADAKMVKTGEIFDQLQAVFDRDK